jgi:F-type H+-transporting ATPase subunit a
MRRLILSLLVSLPAGTALAAGGFSWSHLILGGLEEPLASMGLDPLPLLDMFWVVAALLVLAFVGGKPFRGTEMLEPTGKAGLTHFMEVVVGGILNFLNSIIRHGGGGKPVLALLGTYALFILFMNLQGLVPGFNPPTDQFNVTLPLGVIIFVMTHYLGMKEHGGSYIKHFMGPIWWLAPAMLVIELISHIVRPISLAIRLFGNMTGDHKVVLVFTSIFPILLPVPFMGLGVLVSCLQAFVFVVLSAIYFEGSLGHAH